MAVTNIQLYNEIMRTLMESADSGAAEPTSGMWTRADVALALNLKLQEFAKLTEYKVLNDTEKAITLSSKIVDTPSDAIALREVAFKNASNSYIVIADGSTVEADAVLSDTETAVAQPIIYAIEAAPNLQINLIPPPVSGSVVSYTYVASPTTISTPPSSATVDLADDFTPFLKYGALALLFSRSGETYDPLRAQICQQLYELGVDVTKSWIGGTNG